MKTIILVLALALAAVSSDSQTRSDVSSSSATLRVLAVGDSITMPCTSSPPSGWCGRLSTLLTQAGVTHEIRALAKSGESCLWVADRLVAELAAHPANLVIINCGTGNAMVTAPERAAFEIQWRFILETSHAAGALVLPTFLLYSIDAIQQTQGRPWMLTREREVNRTICSMVKSYPDGWRAGVLDLQPIPSTTTYIEGGTDGIHPNAYGNEVYGTLAYRALRGRYAWSLSVPSPLPSRPRPHTERCSGLEYSGS